jgi:hypothetical protein
VLKPSKEKRDQFVSKFGFATRLDDNEILLCLLEKAAILVK